MADSTVSNLVRASSGQTTDIVPIVRLSASSSQGLPLQALLLTPIVGRDVSTHTVNNSVVTTSIYSVQVPANSMGTNRILRTRILGEYWHSAGATGTMTVRIGFSTTTMWQDTTAAQTVSATSRPVFMQLDLVNNGLTNSQILGGKMEIAAPGATTGQGDAATAAPTDVVIRGTSAIDTTSSATFDVFVAHSVASALVTFASFYGYSELV